MFGYCKDIFKIPLTFSVIITPTRVIPRRADGLIDYNTLALWPAGLYVHPALRWLTGGHVYMYLSVRQSVYLTTSYVVGGLIVKCLSVCVSVRLSFA